MTRIELIDLLRDTFRTYGYEGTTLAKVTEATGLGRGSLYNHFPGGKEQMAQAVLDRVADWFDEVVFAPLRAPGAPADNLHRMLDSLAAYYEGGAASCLAAAMALGQANDSFDARVRRIFATFIDELTALCRRAGQTPAQAKRNATDAVVRIEGALIVARGMGDLRIFADTLRSLPGQLLDGARRPARASR